MTARSSLTVVLAAGEGTRMRSSRPKVLHPVAGQSLLAHVLDAAPHGTGAALAVVIGPDHKAVADEVARIRPDAATFIQAERLGTAHAVLAARAAIARGAGVEQAHTVTTVEEFADHCARGLAMAVPYVVVAKVDTAPRPDGPPVRRKHSDGREDTYVFVRHVERSEGITIMGPSEHN